MEAVEDNVDIMLSLQAPKKARSSFASSRLRRRSYRLQEHMRSNSASCGNSTDCKPSVCPNPKRCQKRAIEAEGGRR